MTDRRRSTQPAPASAAPEQSAPAAAAHPLLGLQQAAGNHSAVAAIQAKLTVGHAGDAHEREADRVASDVVRRLAAGDPLGGATVPDDLADRIDGSAGSGMDVATRSRMEGAFGADFSGVRIHRDAEAATLSDSLQAKAFTTGNDVFFGKQAYDPSSSGGQELLAHELTHVVQQGGTASRKVRRFVDVKAFEKRTSEGAFTGKSTAQKTIEKLLGKYAGLAKKGQVPSDKLEQAQGLLESMKAAAEGWIEAHMGSDGTVDAKRQQRAAGMAWFLMAADGELRAIKDKRSGAYGDVGGPLPKADAGDDDSTVYGGVDKEVARPEVQAETEADEHEAEDAVEGPAVLPPEVTPTDPMGWKLIPDAYKPPAKDQTKYAKFAKERDASYSDEFVKGSEILKGGIFPRITATATDDAEWAKFAPGLGVKDGAVLSPDERANLMMQQYFGWSPADFAKHWSKIGNIGTEAERPTVDALDENDREQYRIGMGSKVTKAVDGTTFDTTGYFAKASGSNHAIFVMSPGGDFYAGSHKVGLFHHSSLLAGGKAGGAGDIIVNKGTLADVSNHSGHYTPAADQMAQVLREVQASGVNLSSVKYRHYSDPDPRFNVGWPNAEAFLAFYDETRGEAPEDESEGSEHVATKA